MTADEKYVKSFYPMARHYSAGGNGSYIVFQLDPDDMDYSLLDGPLTNKKIWAMGRKILDSKMIGKWAR